MGERPKVLTPQTRNKTFGFVEIIQTFQCKCDACLLLFLHLLSKNCPLGILLHPSLRL